MATSILPEISKILTETETVTQYQRKGLCRPWSEAAVKALLMRLNTFTENFSIEVRETHISAGLSHTFLRIISDEETLLFDGVGVAEHDGYFGPEEHAPDHLQNSHFDWIHHILMLELAKARAQQNIVDAMYREIQSQLLDDQTVSLHTESLEERYGKVTAKVIRHDEKLRIIDIVDATGISRTHALTWFPPSLPSNDPLLAARAEIAAGSLIGKTISAHGFKVKKPELASGLIDIPPALQQTFQTSKTQAHFRIYQFVATRMDENCLFGVICEIYSPDFLPPTPDASGVQQLLADQRAEFILAELHDYLLEV